MNVEEKKKRLLKNTGIIAIGTIMSKILMFLLLPLYTAYLTTEDYGTIDLLQTLATLLVPVLSLQLSSASFRFLIESKDDDEKGQIITSSFVFQLIIILIFCIFLCIINCFYKINHLIIFILYFISLIFYTNIQNILRGFGNNKLYSITSFINTFIALILNLLLIIVFKIDGKAILISLTIANTLSSFIGLIKGEISKHLKINLYNKTFINKMIKYSLPLIPNEISWWIANASDRLLISIFISVSANGIYAVANKIPTIFTTIFNVFNIAWVETVSRGINDKNSQKFIINTYDECFKLFSCLCLGIIVSTSIFFNIIINTEYSEAYVHILILMLAIFFSALSSLIGSILTGYKDSKTIGFTTVIGALLNAIINLILIKKIGLYAASISTLISYFIIFYYRNKYVEKYIKLQYSFKYIIILLIITTVTICCYLSKNLTCNIILLIFLFIFSIYVNRKFLTMYIKRRSK